MISKNQRGQKGPKRRWALEERVRGGYAERRAGQIQAGEWCEQRHGSRNLKRICKEIDGLARTTGFPPTGVAKR